MAPNANSPLKLPAIVVGTTDVARLRRELEALYDYLHQAALRHQKADEIKLPKTSRALDELTRLNGIDLMDRDQYDQLTVRLEQVFSSAPKLHISFAADPSSAFTAKLTEWLRANIHPSVLIQVGLQPNIAAGCVVRSTNKQFDLSLRRHLDAAKPKLLERLHGDLSQ